MSLIVSGGYVSSRIPNPGPITQIQSFTYEDGVTHSELLAGIKRYIVRTLEPYLVGLTDELNEKVIDLIISVDTALDEQDAKVDTKIADLTTFVQEQVQLIIDDAIEVQDPVVAGMLADPESATRAEADTLFANKATQETVFTGRLTEASLDAVYEHIEPRDINLREAGVLSTNTAGVNRAALQAAVDSAPAGSLLYLPYTAGTILIDAPINVSTRVRFAGMGGKPTIKQTSSLVPHFQLMGNADVEFSSLRLLGLKTDYVNTEGVYGATAIRVTGLNNRLTVDNVDINDIAGAGIFVNAGAANGTKISRVNVTGVGLATLGTAQYSAGIIIQDGNSDNIISQCDVSQIAQGLVIGHGCKRTTTIDNVVHHTSEHGGYFGASDDYIISRNFWYNTGLLGFKIQLGKTGYTAKNFIISENILNNTGSNSIMITNAIDTVFFATNGVLKGNVVSSSGDTGFRLDRVRGFILSDNMVNGARFAARLFNCVVGKISGNMFMETERTGLLLENCSDIDLSNTRLMNLGIIGPEKVGIIVQGTCSNLRFDSVVVDYDKTAQSDGILIGAGTYANLQAIDCYFRGANWGARTSAAAAAFTVWRNIFAATGGAGAVDGIPSFIPTLPDVALGDLTVAAAELNKVKAILRNQRDAR